MELLGVVITFVFSYCAGDGLAADSGITITAGGAKASTTIKPLESRADMSLANSVFELISFGEPCYWPQPDTGPNARTDYEVRLSHALNNQGAVIVNRKAPTRGNSVLSIWANGQLTDIRNWFETDSDYYVGEWVVTLNDDNNVQIIKCPALWSYYPFVHVPDGSNDTVSLYHYENRVVTSLGTSVIVGGTALWGYQMYDLDLYPIVAISRSGNLLYQWEPFTPGVGHKGMNLSVWNAQSFNQLSCPPTLSFGCAVNDFDEVAAFTGRPTPYTDALKIFFRDRSGAVSMLPMKRPDGTNAEWATINGMNNSGQIIGGLYNGPAVIWDRTALKYLEVPAGSVGGVPLGINKFGQAAGWVKGQYINNQYEPNVPALWENGRFIDLRQRIVNLGDVALTSALEINDRGEILCETASSQLYLLRPIRNPPAVDYNRDGTIKLAAEDASDQTSPEKPYQFWVNDDIDRGNSVDGSDWDEDDLQTAPDGKNDAQENRIASMRDLEDFSRFRISTPGIAALLRDNSNPLYLGLKWTDISNGSPAIKIFPAVEQDGGEKYLTDPDIAFQQINLDYAIQDARDTFTPDISTKTVVDSSGIFIFPKRIFQTYYSSAQDSLHLLFEAVSAGKGQLKFVYLKRDGDSYTEIGDGPGVWMDLNDVKDMYERWTVGDVASSGVDYSAPWPASSASPIYGASGLAMPAPTSQEKDYVLWVHGWNMSTWAKDRFGETAFKRLWRQGYRGRFGVFRWPTYWFDGPIPTPHNFDASEQHAWNSSPALLKLLTGLNTRDSGHFAGHVHVIGHSMGNIVVGESLRLASGTVIKTYIASQAAMSAHCYDHTTMQMLYPIDGPTTPNVYGYYQVNGTTSTPDAWESEQLPEYMNRSYMNGKATKYFNYFNVNDFALNAGHWQLDQQLKPDTGYGFDDAFGRVPRKSFFRVKVDTGDATALNFPVDRYEIFSWAAESRSYALGAQWTQGIFFTNNIDNNVDLTKPPFNFQEAHKYHSGQFRSTNMLRWPYWQQIIRDCNLQTTP